MRLLAFTTVLACVLKVSVQISGPSDGSYVAAVVEYQAAVTTVANLASYLNYITEASGQNADIIVFPELTLNMQDPIEVPMRGLIQQYPIPAINPEGYHNVLVAISAASRQRAIYTVINVEEIVNCTVASEEECPEAKEYLFNSNVVFDRNGAIIDRYRKINLFGERTRTPALTPDLGVFTTDFGVTFGHFICFDLQFQVPALQVVDKLNVTDVIFTTMWFSELPYLTAVQIQEGYAYAMNVNFLASGANNVRVGSAGSGIFSGKAGALVSTMPGLPVSRLLVARVPKVPGEVASLSPSPGPIYDSPSDHDGLTLISDPSLPAHMIRHLLPGHQVFTLIHNTAACSFRINMTLNQPENGATRYTYRAAAFDGLRSYSGLATGGTRLCSVFACTGNTTDTCGKRFPEYNNGTTAVFHELSITATMLTPKIDSNFQARDSAYFPVSLDTSIMPLRPDQFTYTEEIRGNFTVYTMSLKDTDADLYSFAVWGRFFEYDGLEADPPSGIEIIPEENAVDPEPDSAIVHQVNGVLVALVLAVLLT